LGISFGFYNSKTDFDKLSASITSSGGTLPDNSLPTNSNNNATTFDMALGIFYNNEKVYFGISSVHLLENEPKYGGTSIGYLVRSYLITAGYTYQLPNPSLVVVPSFFIQTDGKTAPLTLNTNMIYNNRFWWGLSYRVGTASLGGAVTGLIGFELLSGVRVGYSYDYDTSVINKFSSGTHEFVVIYCFKLNKEKVPQKYKSIRFL
jgi:type IX secretion system PorP/SprF family membrane protein